MFGLFAVLCLSQMIMSAVLPDEKDAIILSYDYQNNGRGNYKFSYVTSNGIIRNETGELAHTSQGIPYINVNGHYSYADPDGKRKIILYSADDKGYHVNFDLSLPHISRSQNTEDENPDGLDLYNRMQSVSPQLLASLLGG